MCSSSNPVIGPARAVLRLICMTALLLVTGCATHYVDGAVKEVAAADFIRPATARPVQVVVEFQTNGTPNARATDHVRPLVMESIRATALFSDPQDKAVPGGALLTVKINNVALLDEAFKKGFMTGLTFGIAGSTVTDGYECSVSYRASTGDAPIFKTSKHAIHTSIGSSDAPPGGLKAASIDEALRTMVRQITAAALRDVSRDPAFK